MRTHGCAASRVNSVANSLHTMAVITREAVRLFTQSNQFLAGLSGGALDPDESWAEECFRASVDPLVAYDDPRDAQGQWAGLFGAPGEKVGSTLRIKLPQGYTAVQPARNCGKTAALDHMVDALGYSLVVQK